MIGCQGQVLLAVVSSVLLLQVSGTPLRDVRSRQPPSELTPDKALAHWLVLQFISELMAPRGDPTLPALEEDGDEDEDWRKGRTEVMRRYLPLSQRERKAGCRNFFWKTFTSC